MPVDGALPEGQWNEHEIIFSHHIALKVVFHSASNVSYKTQCGTFQQVQDRKKKVRQDFAVHRDMVQNTSQFHECTHLSNLSCCVGIKPYTMTVTLSTGWNV